MKTPMKYLAMLALAIASITWLAVRATSTEGEDEGAGFDEHVDAREAFRHLQLQDENGQIPPNGLIDAYNQKENMPFLPQAWGEFMQSSQPTVTGSKPGKLKDTNPGVLTAMDEPDVPNPDPWISIGPGNIGGRIRSIIIRPPDPGDINARKTMWIGAVSGGVWKTTTGGDSWSTTTDFLANIGVHCMAIEPGYHAPDHDVLYAGTGEVFRGNGIFKTVNGGTTWTRLNSTNNPDFYYIYKLAISPTNSQVLLAAVSSDNYNGRIYRSTNAGEGWSLIQTPGTAPIINVQFHPTDGNKCIASTGNNNNRLGGALYSTDAGMTWTAASGLPIPSGRVEVAYARSEPTKVYASVSADNGQLYVSTNSGHSYVNTAASHVFVGTGANGYANALWVDPTNSSTVLVGGAYLSRTTDGGGTWEEASTTGIHADHHVIVEDPGYNGGTGGTPNAIVYGGNDGGIHRASNILFPCPTSNCVTGIGWHSLNSDLAITQFYGAAGHVGPPGDKIIGGTQDNGTLVDHHVFNDWRMMAGALGGDGGFCAADQTTDPYYYGEFFFIQIYRSINGGDTKQYIYNGIADANHCVPGECYANAIAPFILDSNDGFGKTMLAGGRSLWRSTNVRVSQPSWAAIKGEIQASGELRNISAIAVAPGNSNIIWVGHNDGSVYYTTNGMDADPTWLERDAGLPHGRGHMCTRITIGSPNSQGARTVYATFSGFFPSAIESKGNLWKTTDNGQTWADRSSGLPNAPMYSLVISPFNPARLYVGTEVGVFASPDGGATWSPGDRGPANVPVFELFWMGPKLVAATHGRGIFTIGPTDH